MFGIFGRIDTATARMAGILQYREAHTNFRRGEDIRGNGAVRLQAPAHLTGLRHPVIPRIETIFGNVF